MRNRPPSSFPLKEAYPVCPFPCGRGSRPGEENSEFSAEIPASETEAFKNSEFFIPEVSLSRAMMRLSVSYTKAINKRFGRVGSLFQGQFQAKLIQDYHHLLNLCIYIHANPVKDGLVALPEDWIYSSYLEWLGQRDGMLVDREFIREHFGSSAEYQELVMHFVKTRYLPDDVRIYLQMFD